MTYSRAAYHYHLPEELIAQYPVTPRDHSKLMVIDRKSGHITHTVFHELKQILSPGDCLIFNNTKVIPARLMGKRPTGGVIEVFLSERCPDGSWIAMTRPARKLSKGSWVHFSDDFSCEVVEVLEEGMRRVLFHCGEGVGFYEQLAKYGQMPLPQYIKPHDIKSHDIKPHIPAEERYQTVYGEKPGAVAAPTAGLHFTPELLHDLAEKDIGKIALTLHVGLGTFKPVIVDDIRDHKMHSEWLEISQETAGQLNALNPEKRRVAVGTTSCRALESSVDESGLIIPRSGKTDIFIYPGYNFKYINTLLTNFHLPESTLLMLVSTFAGYELTMEAYRKAVENRYRFFLMGMRC